MKKKIWIPIIIAVALLAILFVPFPTETADDGQTKSYTALTYKIVNWNHTEDDDSYITNRLYIIPDNFKSLQTLWEEQEAPWMSHTLKATVLEIDGYSVVVESLEDSKKYTFDAAHNPLTLENVEVGDAVQVTYRGTLQEGDNETAIYEYISVTNDYRNSEYNGEWLDKTTAEKLEDTCFDYYTVREIYDDCFFVEYKDDKFIRVKINGTLPEELESGDEIQCTCSNVYYVCVDETNDRYEADLVEIAKVDYGIPENHGGGFVCYKPVIYLYPEEKNEASVELELDGELTCTYPKYNDGWRVTADTDGTLTDESGKTYNYLYWEGKTGVEFDFSKGFCVKGEDTAEFLETALEKLGLTRKEANEFIVYWLPLMENNEYNIISFQGDNYTEAAKLNVTPNPDTVIRVFMAWQKSEEFVELEEQTLEAPERTGFTVVEWGGSEIENSASN